MRGLRLGLGLGRGGAGEPPAFSVSFTGLSTGVAEIGDHASISVGFPDGVTAWASQAWGASYGASTYGTGTNPTDFAAGNGALLRWEGVGDDGNTYRATAPIRYPAPVLGALTNQTINAADVSPTYDISGEVTFSGTASYSLTAAPSEGGATISSAGVITWDTEILVLQTGTTITVRVADAVDATRFDEASFTLTVEETALIVLTKVSEDFSTSSPEITITYSSGAGETVYWEFDAGGTPPARGAGSFGSGTAGTLGGALSIDLSAFELETGYLHISAGAEGASNSLTYGEFEVPAAASSEYPSTDSSAVTWIDASDASSITHSSDVLTTIADKIGSNDFIPAPEGNINPPLTNTNTINSLNVITMSGSGDVRLENDSFAMPAGDVAIHLVASIDGVSNAVDYLLGYNVGATGELLARLFANNSSQFNGRLAMTDAVSTNNTDLSGGPFSGVGIWSLIFDGTTGTDVEVYYNDTLVGTNPRYNDDFPTPRNFSLFGAPNTTQALQGLFAEMIVTTDITNRADYTTYLADKWGITL